MELVARRADGAVSEELAGETLVLDLDRQRYVCLNATGTLIWQLLERPRDVGELAGALTARWQLEREGAEADVVSFLRWLETRGMVELSDPAR